MEHLIIYFKHGIRDVRPYMQFIEEQRGKLAVNELGEYLGDDMAIDGGDAEAVFAARDARLLFGFLKQDLAKLNFMKGARVTLIHGELGTGADEESFCI